MNDASLTHKAPYNLGAWTAQRRQRAEQLINPLLVNMPNPCSIVMNLFMAAHIIQTY